MSDKCHIRIKFKIKKPITAGTPKVEQTMIVYVFIGKKTPVYFFVKLIKIIDKIPLIAFRNKNLNGLRLLIDKTKI